MCFVLGKKNKFPQIYVYVEDSNEEYIYTSNATNLLGLYKTEFKLDYFIGGSDVCTDDSGGPVFSWFNEEYPTLIGLVIGGMGENGVQYAQKKIIYNEIDSGCAEQNFPGFNLRVDKYLDWILENSKSGNCNPNVSMKC